MHACTGMCTLLFIYSCMDAARKCFIFEPGFFSWLLNSHIRLLFLVAGAFVSINKPEELSCWILRQRMLHGRFRKSLFSLPGPVFHICVHSLLLWTLNLQPQLVLQPSHQPFSFIIILYLSVSTSALHMCVTSLLLQLSINL